MKTPLNEIRITEELAGCTPWWRDGNSIKSGFQFSGFPQALAFVNRSAALAEAANHHPDIDIRWNKVFFTLTTHSSGGLTLPDFELAKSITLVSAEMGGVVLPRV